MGENEDDGAPVGGAPSGAASCSSMFVSTVVNSWIGMTGEGEMIALSLIWSIIPRPNRSISWGAINASSSGVMECPLRIRRPIGESVGNSNSSQVHWTSLFEAHVVQTMTLS